MITVYHPKTLNMLCNIVKIKSVQWTRKFYGCGGFEIHLPLNAPYAEFLQSGNLLRYQGNVGIIRFLQQTEDDITVSGEDLKGLLRQRVVVPPFVYKDNPEVIDGYDRVSGTAEEVMRHYVSAHAIAPTDSKRKIENLSLGSTVSTGAGIHWQARFDNLLDVVSEIGKYGDVGFDILLNAGQKKLVFQCAKGADKTKSIIFWRKFKNISGYDYTLDDTDTVNTAYVGGDGEEERQYIEKVCETEYSGIERREDYVSVSGGELEDVEDKGLSHLRENRQEETVEAEANTKLVYREQWNLGDYVTVKAEALGETVIMAKQITEVKEVYEPGNTYAAPVFGDRKESKLEKIMKG